MTTDLLERFAAQLCAPVPDRVHGPSRLRLLDWLIALRTSVRTEEVDRVRASLALLAPEGTVSLLVIPEETSRHYAAFALARLARSTEVDDLHLSSCTTPGAIVFPALVSAVALEEQIPAARACDAIVTGYEAVMRLGKAIHGPRILSAGVWPSLAVAPIGAAVTVVRALGGSVGEMKDAILSASAMTVLGCPADEMARWLSFGSAVSSGVVAGLSVMLEGERGATGHLEWARTLPEAWDPDALVGPDEPWEAVVATRTKPFCASGQASAAIGIALEHRASLPDQGAVSRIDVFVPAPVAAMVGQVPTGRLSSIASVSYGIAAALCRPELLADCCRSWRGIDPELAGVAKKVHVHADHELTKAYPEHWGARIVLEEADGTRSSWEEGEPVLVASPSREMLTNKARRLLPELAPALLEGLGDLCEGFEDLGELLARVPVLLAKSTHLDASTASRTWPGEDA